MSFNDIEKQLITKMCNEKIRECQYRINTDTVKTKRDYIKIFGHVFKMNGILNKKSNSYIKRNINKKWEEYKNYWKTEKVDKQVKIKICEDIIKKLKESWNGKEKKR